MNLLVNVCVRTHMHVMYKELMLMKQWQPLGGGRWWMEGSWWLCWVAAHSLSFPLSPISITRSRSFLTPSPFLSPSLSYLLIHVPVSPFSSGDEWWREDLSCLHSSSLPVGVSTSPTSSTLWTRYNLLGCRETDEDEGGGGGTQTDMQGDRSSIERDGGTDREKGRHRNRQRRDRWGSQRWVKRSDNRHCKASLRPDQWSASAGEIAWHLYDFYLQVSTLLLILKF